MVWWVSSPPASLTLVDAAAYVQRIHARNSAEGNGGQLVHIVRGSVF